eukprot:2312171-Amphidinium_carterae.1
MDTNFVHPFACGGWGRGDCTGTPAFGVSCNDASLQPLEALADDVCLLVHLLATRFVLPDRVVARPGRRSCLRSLQHEFFSNFGDLLGKHLLWLCHLGWAVPRLWPDREQQGRPSV